MVMLRLLLLAWLLLPLFDLMLFVVVIGSGGTVIQMMMLLLLFLPLLVVVGGAATVKTITVVPLIHFNWLVKDGNGMATTTPATATATTITMIDSAVDDGPFLVAWREST